MAAEKNSVHVRLTDEQHRKLTVMAEFQSRNACDLAAQLLEKMIVAEYHDFIIVAQRCSRLGLSASGGDKLGKGGK